MIHAAGSAVRLAAALALVSGLAACAGEGPGQTAAVQIDPPSAQVGRSGLVQFNANTAVTWSVQEAGGGTVDGSGLYTAPPSLGTFHVVATSAASPGASGTASVTVSDVPPTDVIPASRRTVWNPGIPGGIPRYTNVHTTIQAATFGNGSSDATGAINNALAAAGAVASATNPQVVLLSSGLFRINGEIGLNYSYVTLRGSGRWNGATGTRLRKYGVNADMFQMGGYPNWSASAVNVAGSVPKGASSFTLADGHGVRAGDLLVIDMLDDASITLGGGTWWKRGPGNTDNGPPSSGYRSIGQVVEVTAVNGNQITIEGILHQAYPASRSPQVFGATNYRAGAVRRAGLEDMTVTGWGDAAGLPVWWTRQCWVKNVEFDGYRSGTDTGPASNVGTEGYDLRLFRSVRFQIEGSYFHHSRTYITNNHAYSISLAMQSSDNLVQDNIVWFKNKNIVLEASGGGNVIAYNYVDDPVIDSPPRTDWMEQCIDGSHLSHPSMDLFEGNYTAKMGAADVHGSASEQTFFRNYSKGDRLYTMTTNPVIAAVVIAAGMRNMNVVGNVLATRPGGIYAPAVGSNGYSSYADSHTPMIFRLGYTEGNWEGPVDRQTEGTLLRVGNWDSVRGVVDQQPGSPLPASLYLVGKPAFFGARDWPWVEPSGATAADRVKVLPAQARFQAGTF